MALYLGAKGQGKTLNSAKICKQMPFNFEGLPDLELNIYKQCSNSQLQIKVNFKKTICFINSTF